LTIINTRLLHSNNVHAVGAIPVQLYYILHRSHAQTLKHLVHNIGIYIIIKYHIILKHYYYTYNTTMASTRFITSIYYFISYTMHLLCLDRTRISASHRLYVLIPLLTIFNYFFLQYRSDVKKIINAWKINRQQYYIYIYTRGSGEYTYIINVGRRT